MKLNSKNKKIVDYVLETMKIIDPSLFNYKWWKTFFEKMDDRDFDRYMKVLKEGREVIHLLTPNQKVILTYEDIEKAGDFVGTSFYHHLIIKDPDTGIKFVTPEKYLIIECAQRRLEQTLEEKISIPRSDTIVDGMTGQVTGDDRSCSITNPEIQAIYTNEGDKILHELAVARGGNMDAYSQLKHQLEEIGECNVEDVITDQNQARSIRILDVYLSTMGYKTNLSKPYQKVEDVI